MERLRPWLAAVKPEQAALAPLAVAVGCAYSSFDARTGPRLAVGLLLPFVTLLAGAGVNLVDHAWDRLSEPPPDRKNPVPESARPVDAREGAVAGGIALAAAAALAAVLTSQAGAAWLGYGAVAVALGVVRGAPGLGLDTVGFGLGELGNALALGPLAALAGFASLAGAGSWGAFLAGVPSGAIAAAPLFARHFVRSSADERHQRATPVAILGEEGARQILVVFPLIAAGAVVIAASAGEYPAWTRLAVLPLAVAAATGWRIPRPAEETGYARWGRLATGCSLAALAIVALALWCAPRV